MDIHNYKRRLERTIQNIGNSNLSAENKKTIMKFHDNCLSEELSICKIERYIYDLRRFAEWLNKELLDASKDDIRAVVGVIEKKEWSPNSKHTFKVMIRKFYKSIEGIDEKGVYPERVRWLHSNVKNNNQKMPSELVTEGEVRKMIAHALSVRRDKAFISILYESGCRIGEIGLLKIKDITFDQYGAAINVNGKTGPRRVRIIISSSYLKEWINKHEFNYDPNYYVWIQRNGKILGYNRLCDIIKKNAKAVGIRKRIHPHLFRHSRATFLANKLTETQMKQYLGWTQSSRMAAVYAHLFEKLCRNFSISKQECWELLFLLKEFELIEIVKGHGIRIVGKSIL